MKTPFSLRWAGVSAALFGALGIASLAGCAGPGYYWQSVSGHLHMLNLARPVDEVMADPKTSAKVKDRLALSQRIRSFAADELKLPDNPSYRRYADLHRNAVVWNVVAAPAFSLKLKTWCFPVTGCVGYRGYFDESQARQEAERLRADGLEVTVYGVPAYSTLGWMNWAGGDPLLNTFINYPEGELARLIFHELAHQVVYASGDTMFNESFATAVERLGSQRWLQSSANAAARAEYAAFDQRRQAFRALALATRRELQAIYGVDASNRPLAQKRSGHTAIKGIANDLWDTNDTPVARQKAKEAKDAAMQRFRDSYAALKASWGGYAGYDPWVARANNAAFGAQATYDELVPGFESLFAREGHDWQRFYDAVRQLAKLPKDKRHDVLMRDALITNPTEKLNG
ncbi:MAG: aminopeptidase [Polaromonas sp.]|nr:aminopeptidase [Polaromonas sp.]